MCSAVRVGMHGARPGERCGGPGPEADGLTRCYPVGDGLVYTVVGSRRWVSEVRCRVRVQRARSTVAGAGAVDPGPGPGRVLGRNAKCRLALGRFRSNVGPAGMGWLAGIVQSRRDGRWT